MAKPVKKLLLGYLLLSVLTTVLSCAPSSKMDGSPESIASEAVPTYTFKIINAYPHDRDAFTQGLAYADNTLFESTGKYSRSSLRRVDLLTGKVLQIHNLQDEYFAEGITVFRDTIIQLTWRSKKGFIYDKDSFKVLGDFTYETEGWGITHDGERLIMSDGTSTLYFLEADTFKISDYVRVHDNNKLINNLNELEFIDGKIYANIWQTDNIAIIDPQNGRVTGWIDLSGILPPQPPVNPIDVLNGIAYDTTNKRLFVTGKLWPQLFEIQLMIED